MMLRTTALIAGLALGTAHSAAACQPNYTVKAGDTLFSIAESNLGDMTKWSLIFYNNPQLGSGNLVDVPAGEVLTIPCPEGTVVVHTEPEIEEEETVTALAATPLSRPVDQTPAPQGAKYPPFTDWNWPAQRMLSDVVKAAMEDIPDPIPFSFMRDDDWSEKAELAKNGSIDLIFPAAMPNCAAEPESYKCATFHFTEPLVEVVVLLFAKSGSSMTYTQDSDLHGKTLCRPSVFYTHDLDTPGRELLSNGLINLEQPASAEQCFDMLMNDEVDAVVINEFLGVQKLFQMGLTRDVMPLSKPVSIQGLHAAVPKNHWRGTSFLYRFNTGLATLRASDRYDSIVKYHVDKFWRSVNR